MVQLSACLAENSSVDGLWSLAFAFGVAELLFFGTVFEDLSFILLASLFRVVLVSEGITFNVLTSGTILVAKALGSTSKSGNTERLRGLVGLMLKGSITLSFRMNTCSTGCCLLPTKPKLPPKDVENNEPRLLGSNWTGGDSCFVTLLVSIEGIRD